MGDDAGPLITKIADILAKDQIVVEKRTQIYYGLGLDAGADFHMVKEDAGNKIWDFFHIMLQHYFSKHTDTHDAHKKIVECLKSLELVFCAVRVADLDSKIGRTSGGIFWHNMEDVCSNFVGRKAEFQKLEQCLQRQNSTTEFTVLTSVSGMGGIGKTTLARKFAYHFRRVLSGSVAWIPAENVSLVAEEFAEIGDQLSITKKSLTRKFAKAIYEALMRKNDNVLFIFDNLDDPINKWIHEFLPNGLEIRRPFILITSRRRDIVRESSNVVDLDVLSPDDALQMIQKVCSSISNETGGKLAEALQFYPLALQIALSEIGCIQSLNKNEATLKYIEAFNENKSVLLDEDENLPLDYKFTLSVSLKITLSKLGKLKNGNEILNLLRVISIIYPDEIETDFLYEIFKQTKEPKTFCDDILEILCKHSILSIVFYKNRKVYKIHRMIQYVIHQDSNTEQMKDAVKIMLTWNESVNYFRIDYLNHAEFVMKYLKENKSIHGLESYIIKMKSIVTTYAAKDTGIPVEFMSSFMTKHFGEEPELYIDYIRRDYRKTYAFLKPKFKILLSLIDLLVVAALLLRDKRTSKISKENLHLLQDMFSVSEDDIIHKFRPFIDETFIHIEGKSEHDFIYLYVEKYFLRFFLSDVKMNAEFKDQVKKFSEHLITENFGLIGLLILIHAAEKEDLGWWNESDWHDLYERIQNSPFVGDYFYRIRITYNKLYEILFPESPFYLYHYFRGSITNALDFRLHLCNSISDLASGNSIIIGFTKQDWTNLLYDYDWLFTSAPLSHSLLQETQEFVNRVNTQLSESKLKNVKLYSLLVFLKKGSVSSNLIRMFDFPENFEEKLSKLELGFVLKNEFYLDPLVSIVCAKSCDKTILIEVYRTIIKAYTSLGDFITLDAMYLASCILLHEICSNDFTDETQLIFPITLIFACNYGTTTYVTLTERGVEKLYGLFLKSLECSKLKEKEYVVRLKNELKQCFNILDINIGDFESDFKYFITKVLPEIWRLHSRQHKPIAVESFNGKPVYIRDHQVLENIISRLCPPEPED